MRRSLGAQLGHTRQHATQARDRGRARSVLSTKREVRKAGPKDADSLRRWTTDVSGDIRHPEVVSIRPATVRALAILPIMWDFLTQGVRCVRVTACRWLQSPEYLC